MSSSREGQSRTWKVYAGPLLTLVIVVAARLLQLYTDIVVAPNLDLVLLAAVILSVFWGGWKAGVISGAMSVVAYAYVLSRGTWRFGAVDSVRVASDLAITIPVLFLLGRLVLSRERAAQREHSHRLEAEAARTATTDILESITDAFFVVDRAWRYVYINPQAEQHVGRARDELIGVTLWEAFPPLVGSRWEVEYRRALDSGESVHFEEYYPPLAKWFETHAYPSASGLSIYLRDITDRVRAEHGLKSRVLQQAAIAYIGQLALEGKSIQVLLDEAVARLAAVFDVELAKVLERQPDGQLLMRAGVGWKPGLVGSTLVPPDADSQAGYTLLAGQPVIVEDLRTERRFRGPDLLVDHDVASGLSLLIPGRDGPYGILAVHSTRPRSFTSDDVMFIAGMAHILGFAIERRAALSALEESEERFRQIAERIQEVLFVNDLREPARGYVSPAYETVWGRSVASWYAEPTSWLDAVHPDDRTSVEEWFAAIDTGPFDIKFRIVRPDGTIRWIHDRAFALRDQDGDVCRIVGLAEDVTAKKQFGEEHAARAAAEARAHARDELLAAVSHDLRNPLSAIELVCEVMLGESVVARPHVEAIRRSARHMMHLIQDLSDAARVEAGAELALVTAEVDPDALLQTLGEVFSLQAKRKSITLTAASPRDLPALVADGNRLLRALENLVGNAIKFTPPGGQVWIDVGTEGECMRFSVSDTGPGIPPENTARLFERYWQASPDRRGLGLGLPIVKGIAEAHGGRVWVEPRPGGGSTFHLAIPMIPPGARDEPRLQSDDAARSGTR